MSGWVMKSAQGEEWPFVYPQQGWPPLLQTWHRSSSEALCPQVLSGQKSFAQVYQPRNLLADHQTALLLSMEGLHSQGAFLDFPTPPPQGWPCHSQTYRAVVTLLVGLPLLNLIHCATSGIVSICLR